MFRPTRLFVSLGLAGLLSAGLIAARQSSPQTPPQTPPPGSQARTEAQDPQQPVFRTGINFVRVDVIVTDGKGNPIIDLTQDDFEVREDGALQTLESFDVIRISQVTDAEAEVPRPIRTTYDQETEAARPDTRLFVIVLDDYHVRRGAGMAVREPLARFIQQQLSARDMVALMYPLTPIEDVQFSRDREALAAAVRRFEGRKFNYEPRNQFEEQYAYYPAQTVEMIRNQVSLSALRGLVTYLGGVREGRKAVILVSEGYTYNMPPQLNNPIASMPGVGNPMAGRPGEQSSDPRADASRFFRTADMMSDLREVFDAANRNNTAIYTLDPRGLAAFEFDINEGVGLQTDRVYLQETLDTLHVLADETDGRAIVNSNDLDAGLRQVVRDSSAYYLLGYSSPAPTDGKFHEIKVRVKRGGVQVRGRKGYWAYSAEDAARATATPGDGPPPDVTEALAGLAEPPRGRAARVWVGTTRAADGLTRVRFVWEPLPPQPGEARGAPAARASVVASGSGNTVVFRGTVEPPPIEPGAARRPASVVFDAAPGQVQFRISYETDNGRLVDSERLVVTLPDYTAAEVQLSTPRIFRTRTPREMQAIRADADAAPTGVREFSRRERLLIRFEAYAPGATPPTVAARLLNRQAAPMADLTVEPPGESGVTYYVDLPLAGLAPGEYLVEVSAMTADGSATRQLVGVKVTS